MSVVDPIRVTLHVQEASPITVNSNILPKIIEGISPEVSLEETADGVVMTVTDKSGTETALIPKGPQGDDYVLTDEDKTEIATETAEMIDLSGKADKADTVLDTTLSRGRKANTTVGQGSIAYGSDVEASGQYSVATGVWTTASGSNSHAEGMASTASANAAHAEGGGIASGNYAHAEGGGTASGSHSHAENYSTTASGQASHADGYCTTASRKSQHVFGEYNVPESGSATTKGTYVEIVGNGRDSTHRSNARTLDWNGNEQIAGKMTVGIDPASDMDVTTKRYVDQNFATKEYVDNNFAAADAMIFKGTIGTGGTITALPATHSKGWTYRVIEAGTYAGAACEIGDLIICIEDGTVADNSDWVIAQGNIDGEVIGPSSSVDGNVALFDGTTGKLIKDSGVGLGTKADKTDTVLDTTLSRGRKANTTVGQGSIAYGSDVEASGQGSVATGGGTTASGAYSHSEGNGTAASGNGAHSEGGGTRASGAYSHSEGAGTTASGHEAHSEGSGTTASGFNAHSEGGSTEAAGTNSHAEGSGTKAVGRAQHTQGEYNVLDSATNEGVRGTYAEIVGNGTDSTHRSNARALDWIGNERLTGDLYVGCNSDSTGGTAVGASLSGKADKTDTVLNTTLSLGRKANTTVGAGSVTLGDKLEASGSASLAEGYDTHATAAWAHSEGVSTYAEAGYAHAEGASTHAAKYGAHAEGNSTRAAGAYSHAEGQGTKAAGASQHVSGDYNVENAPAAGEDYATFVEIVGNGDDDNSRSNARALDWDGNERLNGDLYINCNSDSTGGTAVGSTLSTLSSAITAKQDAPASGSAAGKVLGLSEVSSELVPTWVDQPTVPVTDVQVDGTSVLSNGIANVPKASSSDLGVVKVNSSYGIKAASSGTLQINYPDNGAIKAGTNQYAPIVPYKQDISTFYGLAKAAGADMASSSNPVGTYTEDAKKAICAMIGVKYDAPFRLIKTITISEETAYVYVTTDANGEAISLDEVTILFENVISNGNGTGGISVNGGNSQTGDGRYLAAGSLCSTTAQTRIAHICRRGGKMFGEITANAVANVYTAVSMSSSKNATGIMDCDKITEICIGSLNTYKFTSGTITIYGR